MQSFEIAVKRAIITIVTSSILGMGSVIFVSWKAVIRIEERVNQFEIMLSHMENEMKAKASQDVVSQVDKGLREQITSLENRVEAIEARQEDIYKILINFQRK
jgi:hypothetical protein